MVGQLRRRQGNRRRGARTPPPGAADLPPGPAASTVTGAAALSSDEREVAALVASGKTNKEIAAALYLSEKTIETPTLERQRLKHPSLLTVTRDSTAHGPTLTPNADYFRCLRSG